MIVATLFISGCGVEDTKNNNDITSPKVTISGHAGTGTTSTAAVKPLGSDKVFLAVTRDSVIADGIVKVYSKSGELLGSGVTAADGSFSINVDAGNDYFIVITSSDGETIVKAYVPTVGASGQGATIVNAYTSTIIYGMEEELGVTFGISTSAYTGNEDLSSLATQIALISGFDDIVLLVQSDLAAGNASGLSNTTKNEIAKLFGSGKTNTIPVANAGSAQNIHTGSLVTLDGSESNDADGDSLTYSWTFTSIPSGSSASLSDSTLINPTFTADLDGSYLLNLTVNDGIVSSAAATVTISAVSSGPPVANAGADQDNAMIRCPLQLDGSGSFDPGGNVLTYSWDTVSAPAGSILLNAESMTGSNPTVNPDLAGRYSFQLTINNGTVDDSDMVNLDVLSASAFPNRTDCYEDDNVYSTAKPITVGDPVQVRTLYPPIADVDWVSVDLTGGVTYELFTTNLNETADTYLSLYDTDGTTEVDSNDDYLNYDSNIEFTPTTDGTYYLRVEHVDNFGIAAYSLGVREFVDNDSDGYSPFYDCDDNDSDIAPGEDDIPGDGIDQNCDGFDVINGTVTDSHEDDDSASTAVIMIEAGGSYYEEIYRSDINNPVTGNARTIHTAGEVDYFQVTIPAFSMFIFGLTDQSNLTDLSTLYDSDGTTELDSGSFIYAENTSNTSKTYYLSYQASDGTSTGFYVPFYTNYGTDADGDGYYTQDWDVDRDCDDTDPDINYDATEIVSDGIDSNCNGEDDS